MNLSGIDSPRAGAGPERLAAALTYRYAIDRARGAGPGGAPNSTLDSIVITPIAAAASATPSA